MKRLLALICAFLLAFNVLNVFAQDDLSMKIEAESYIASSGVRNYQNRGTGEVISINTNGTASYSFSVTKSGRYELSVNYATSKTPEMTMVISDEDETVILPTTGGNNTYASSYFATVALVEGEHSLDIEAKDIGFAIDYFELTYIGEYETGLSDENKFEAETFAKEENVLDGASGSVAKIDELNPIEFDVNSFSEDVYKLYLNYMAEEPCEYVVYLNDELIYSGLFNESDEYVTNFIENIRIPVGKSKIRIEAETKTTYIDYVELIKNKKEIKENEKSIFEAENYDSSSGDITASGASPRYISFSNGKWVSFDVDVEKGGKYKVSVSGALAPDNGYPHSTIGVCLDDEKNELFRGNVEITEGWVDFKTFSLGTIILPEGKSTIIFKVLYAASHIDNFALQYLDGECELDTVYTDEDILANNTHLSKGTDRFYFLFNQEVDKESINENTIKLESYGESYPLLFTVSKNLVTADLKKSLADNADYVLSVTDVKDEFGALVLSKQYVFTADGVDSGLADIKISESAIDYDKVKIKGTMYSKYGVGISGRRAELIFGDNVSSEALSEENGEFEILWTVPSDTQSGLIDVFVSGEYVNNAKKLQLLYLSKNFEDDILNQIKEADTKEKVEEILSSNEETLNINLKDIKEGTKEGSVFLHLINAEFDRVYELLEKLYSCSLLEKINGADDEKTIEDIIYDEENAKLLNLEFEKISEIINNRQDFLKAIYDSKEFSNLLILAEKINALADAFACKEFDKNTAELICEDKSVYIGEGAKIKFGFKEKQTEVKNIVFELSADEGSFIKDIQYKKIAKGNYTANISDNKFVLDFVADIDENEFDEIAEITLGAAESKGTFKMKLNAEVVYKIDKPYTITYKCPENVFEVNVSKRSSNSTSGGGGQSSRPSSGGSKMEIPPQKVDDNKEDIKEDNKETYKFNDVADSMWAKDYIYALLEKGVISKSDDNKFNPDSLIKREEFIKMVVVALGIFDENATTDLNDINGNEWFAGYVASAQKAGIISGRDDGSFGVGDNIKREDMATILYRALGVEKTESVKFTDDSDISDYAKDAVYSMKDSGFITGFPDNTFRPRENSTKAQAAKILYMMMEVAK